MVDRFGKARTKRGFLEPRASLFGHAGNLDMPVLHQHIRQGVYNLELSGAVSNAWRVLQDEPGVRGPSGLVGRPISTPSRRG